MEVGKEFSSWAQFSSTLQLYSKENKVSYSPGVCKTIESANKNETLNSKFPARFQYCFVRMVCTHGLKSGHLRQGSEKNQKFPCSCLSSILVTVNKNRTGLFIQEAHLVHNHDDVDIVFSDDHRLAREEYWKASILLHARVPPLYVKDFILKCRNENTVSESFQETGCKEAHSVIDSDYISFIEEILAENPACNVELIRFNLTPGAIYIQTIDMKERMIEFKEGSLQMISHQIPCTKLTVICLVGVDIDLETHLFAVFISPSIDDTIIHQFLESFVKNNQQICDSIEGIVFDSSVENAEFLQILIPHVNVAWSRSYIIDKFEDLADKSQSSSGSQLSLLKELMNSESEEEYNRVLKRYLAHAHPSSANKFLEEWDSHKNLWVQYEIVSCQGLKHQKSAIEMDFINRFCNSPKVPDTLSGIMKCLLHNDDMDDVIRSCKEGQNEEPGSDVCSSWYKSFCQPYAAESVIRQIAVANNSQYEINAQNDMVILKRLDSEDEFILNGDKCTCKFHLSTELPCQHIFACLKVAGRSFCDESLVPLKWTLLGKDLRSISISGTSPQEFLPTAILREMRIKAIHRITRETLFTCESHSFSELGDDLILLKTALSTMKKLKTGSGTNDVFLSSENRQETGQSVKSDNGQTVESIPKSKRGRLRKKDKQILSPSKSVQPQEPLPVERRHNLRTNIKHKFVSRAPVVPFKEDLKDNRVVKLGKSDIGLLDDVTSPSHKSESLTTGGQKKKYIGHNISTKELMVEPELDQNEDLELTQKNKEETNYSAEAGEIVDVLLKKSLKRPHSPEDTVQSEEAKTIFQSDLTGVETCDEEDGEDDKGDYDSQDEKACSDDSDDDDTQSTFNEENKSQRNTDLNIFVEELSIDELQQLMQGVSTMHLPGEKTLLDGKTDDYVKSPADYLIDSLSTEEDALDLLINYLCKTCLGYDKRAYRVAACIILKAFNMETSVLDMMQTVYDWPSHLCEAQKPEENVANPPSDQMLTVCGQKLSSDDLTTLYSPVELSLSIIHAYLEVLAQRHNGKLFVIPFEVVHHWRNGNFGHMIFKKVHFKTFDYLILPIHCGSEFFNQEVTTDSSEGIKPCWMSLVADVRNKTVSVLNPRSEDKYAIAANGYMLQWRRYMQIRSVHTGEMLLTWNSKKTHCSRQTLASTSGAMLLMNVESVINNVPPAVMTEAHLKKYLQYMAVTLRDTDRETTVLCVGGPECQQMAARDADWLQCENCHAWWHRACAGHMDHSHVFYCTSCQQRIISVNSSINMMCTEEEEDEEELEEEEEENETEIMEEEDNKENNDSVTENTADEDVDNKGV